jgi:hypothetical protein
MRTVRPSRRFFGFTGFENVTALAECVQFLKIDLLDTAAISRVELIEEMFRSQLVKPRVDDLAEAMHRLGSRPHRADDAVFIGHRPRYW